jgi:hypothetical protein
MREGLMADRNEDSQGGLLIRTGEWTGRLTGPGVPAIHGEAHQPENPHVAKEFDDG